jgi:hypothetical protein
MKLFFFITDLVRFEFDIFESNLINLIVLGGIVVNYVFFPAYGGFSKRRETIKSAFIKSMEAEEELRLALVESYYKVFLNETFFLVSLAVLSRKVQARDSVNDLKTLNVPAFLVSAAGGGEEENPYEFGLGDPRASFRYMGPQRRETVLALLPRRYREELGYIVPLMLPRLIGSDSNPLPSTLDRFCTPVKNFDQLWEVVSMAAEHVFFCKKILYQSKRRIGMKNFLYERDLIIRRLILLQDRVCIKKWKVFIENSNDRLRLSRNYDAVIRALMLEASTDDFVWLGLDTNEHEFDLKEDDLKDEEKEKELKMENDGREVLLEELEDDNEVEYDPEFVDNEDEFHL